MKFVIILCMLLVVSSAGVYVPPYAPASPQEVCALLRWAAARSSVECAAAMVERSIPGAWANASAACAGEGAEPPLHAVAAAGRADALRLLLALGAPIEGRDRSGRTALHVAVNGSEGACVEELLFAGADPSAADDAGDTPLHVAVRAYVHADVVDRNFESSREVNRRDYNPMLYRQSQPLHYRQYQSPPDVRPILWKRIVQLLYAGARRSFAKGASQTPLVIALESARPEDEKLVRLLLGHVDLSNSFPAALCAAHEYVRWPSEEEEEEDGYGVRTRVNGSDRCGRSELHVAAINGESAEVDNATAVDARDALGRTALHEAARRDGVQLMRALLAAGADPDAADWLGLTPLHLAALCGRDDARQLLQVARADRGRHDRLGRSPDDLARGALFPAPSSAPATSPAPSPSTLPATFSAPLLTDD